MERKQNRTKHTKYEIDEKEQQSAYFIKSFLMTYIYLGVGKSKEELLDFKELFNVPLFLLNCYDSTMIKQLYLYRIEMYGMNRIQMLNIETNTIDRFWKRKLSHMTYINTKPQIRRSIHIINRKC